MPSRAASVVSLHLRKEEDETILWGEREGRRALGALLACLLT